jgi:beta-glucanase (GH16 family)
MNRKLTGLLIVCCFLTLSSRSQDFYDDFNGKHLNKTLWKKIDQKWGENPAKGTHGGVIARHVTIQNGQLVIQANGNLYTGSTWGHGQITKVGGAVSTKKAFASGRYELRAKICPQAGALSAFWTYYNYGDSINHEIDFEFPGRNQAPNTPDSSNINWGLMTNWQGVKPEEYITKDQYFGNQADGQYHLYRFEWHTGSPTEKARVEWYYDDILMHTSFNKIPNIASNFWIGIWFPWWIAPADFATDYMYVDWIKIRPYNEPGDQQSYKDKSKTN